MAQHSGHGARQLELAGAPAQEAMAPRPDVSRYACWSPQEVATYFSTRGYPEYAELWVRHKLSGARIVLLAPSHLESMGIDIIGDRLGIQQELRALKSVARQAQRNTVIAEHQEAFPGSYFDQMCQTGCFSSCCPWERSHFTLTSNTLKMRSYHVERCMGRKCACMGGEWTTDTIRLDRIIDVDTVISVKGCGCCAERKCSVQVAAQAGTGADSDESRTSNHEMLVDADEGEEFAQKIRNQIDEYRTTMNESKDAA
eukprot:TRINITY_DN5246_c0_g2_i1.p1 TRINITY_DN5246_c0_g2~~TRINITY_DN5246_c0_g2_i1.p1  ORF type:complete len:256 (+),score=29.78 TRINITY_DN5246_c0_g2_i1:50-817(+)